MIKINGNINGYNYLEQRVNKTIKQKQMSTWTMYIWTVEISQGHSIYFICVWWAESKKGCAL